MKVAVLQNWKALSAESRLPLQRSACRLPSSKHPVLLEWSSLGLDHERVSDLRVSDSLPPFLKWLLSKDSLLNPLIECFLLGFHGWR